MQSDGTNLLHSEDLRECDEDIKKIEECTLAVQNWFLQNDLQFNPAKSKMITLTTVAQRYATISTAGS